MRQWILTQQDITRDCRWQGHVAECGFWCCVLCFLRGLCGIRRGTLKRIGRIFFVRNKTTTTICMLWSWTDDNRWMMMMSVFGWKLLSLSSYFFGGGTRCEIKGESMTTKDHKIIIIAPLIIKIDGRINIEPKSEDFKMFRDRYSLSLLILI